MGALTTAVGAGLATAHPVHAQEATGDSTSVDATPAPAVASPTTLVNQLGNASLTFSIEHWQVFARGGVGVARGRQDLQDSEGAVTVASGLGLGYSVGGGITLPIASRVSLALFANWNVDAYDLSTPSLVLERGVRHEYVEVRVRPDLALTRVRSPTHPRANGPTPLEG